MKKIIILLAFLAPGWGWAQETTFMIRPYPPKHLAMMIETGWENGKPEKVVYEVNGETLKFSFGEMYVNGQAKYEIKDEDDKITILDISLPKPKKVGSFKIKTIEEYKGKFKRPSTGYSLDGKYAIILGRDEQNLYLYKFDLATRKLVEEGTEIPFAHGKYDYLYSCSLTMDGKYLYYRGMGDGFFYHQIDLQSKTVNPISIEFNGSERKNGSGLYTTSKGNYLVISNPYQTHFVDAKTLEQVFQQPAFLASNRHKKLFFTPRGEKKELIEGQKISEPGIGLYIREKDALVFDHEQTYFMISIDGTKTDVGDYVSLDGSTNPLDYQPEFIPFVSYLLEPSALFRFLEKIAREGHNKDFNHKNRDITYAVLGLAEPLDDLTLKEIATESSMGYLKAYGGAGVVRWINEIDENDLAKESEATTIKIVKYLKWYKELVQENDELLLSLELPELYEIDAAINKLIPYSEGIQNMTVQEMIDKGNSILVSSSSLSPSSALLAIKYFETAQEKEPFDPIHAVNIGNAFLFAKRYEQAAQNYNKALAIKPDYPLALYGLMRTVHEPVKNRETELNANIAGSISANANRFLAVAPSDYNYEIEIARKIGGTMDLYVKNQALFAEYQEIARYPVQSNLMSHFSSIIPKLEMTGANYLAADIALKVAEFYRNEAETQGHRLDYYLFADAMYEKASKENLMTAKSYYNWANINLTYVKRTDEGMKIVAGAKMKFPGDENFDHLEAVIGYHAGTKAYLAGNYAEAIPHLETYLKSPADQSSMARPYLGISYYQMKRYEEAVETLEKCKEEEALNTLRAYFPDFEQILAYAKKPSGSAPAVKDNSKKIREVQEAYQEAQKLDAKGDWENALVRMKPCAEYFAEIDFDFGLAIVYSGMGTAAHKSGNLEAAKSYYRQCIENGATSSSCYNNLALIKLDEKKLAETKSLLDAGNELYPGSHDLQLTYADYYMERGFEDYRNKYFASAISNLKRSIEYSDDDPVTRMFLGFAYYADGNLGTSKRVLREALNMDPSLRNEYEAVDQILNQ